MNINRKMYRKTYKVKGYDVSDFMVMQSYAYHLYAANTLKAYLFHLGYSKKKLTSLGVDIKPIWQNLNTYNTLLFTQKFTVNMQFTDMNTNGILQVNCRFFNARNELCALVLSSFYINKNFRKELLQKLSIPITQSIGDFSEPGLL